MASKKGVETPCNLDYPDRRAMHLCACVRGVTVHTWWVWRLLNEHTKHACNLENASNDRIGFFMKSFVGLHWRKNAALCQETRSESRNKTKYFSYLDYFTYPVLQHGGHGQRCLDNRGCTVLCFNIYIQYTPEYYGINNKHSISTTPERVPDKIKTA